MSKLDIATLLVGITGAAAVTTGAALLHPAAGWISGGCFALVWSYRTARAAAQKGQ